MLMKAYLLQVCIYIFNDTIILDALHNDGFSICLGVERSRMNVSGTVENPIDLEGSMSSEGIKIHVVDLEAKNFVGKCTHCDLQE